MPGILGEYLIFLLKMQFNMNPFTQPLTQIEADNLYMQELQAKHNSRCLADLNNKIQIACALTCTLIVIITLIKKN